MPELMLRGGTMYEAVCNELKLYKEENEKLRKKIQSLQVVLHRVASERDNAESMLKRFIQESGEKK